MDKIIWIVIAVATALFLYVIAIYNNLVKMVNRAKEAWADIDVQLKRRYDLVPNLVETVKGYAKHEREVLEAVIEARAKAMGAKGIKEREEAEAGLTGTLKSLFALSENYPTLKANENFLELQRELSDTENKIQSARRFYNTNVRDLSIAIESFPSNVVASSFGFEKMEMFEIENLPEREVVKVSF
ncbi:MAG: LemA family protein [Candidatus Harrisonbacteria bacterium]|nr:LemA family protein [Candidatus Harrisonbacteria bacterium]